MKGTINGLALCAGYGGIELGLSLALGDAYRTVGYVEREAYAAALIVARMADKALDQAPVWDDLKTFDGRPWRGAVDIITAGYPCQPFSLAGKRLGADDPRHLWPSVARIVREISPAIVFCENVTGHINLGFREVAGELQEMGYRVAAVVRSAADLGSTHERERLFILAHNSGKGLARKRERTRSKRQNVALSTCDCLLFPPGREPEAWREVDDALKPAVPRMAHGSADRVDSIRATGNGVVPCVAAAAFIELVQAMELA